MRYNDLCLGFHNGLLCPTSCTLFDFDFYILWALVSDQIIYKRSSFHANSKIF